MPYTKKQNKLFQAAAHNKQIAKKLGLPQEMAKKMAKEPMKKSAKSK